MGILSRISKVLESNLNALVDKAEDPAKMLDQAIEDMKKGRNEARQAIIEARTQKRILEKRREKSLGDALIYEKKAIQALKNGDEDMARRCLEMKIAAERRGDAEASAVAEQEAQIGQLELAERELERRLAEMPARRAALMARQAAAQAKGARVGASDKAKNSVSSALEAFDRMEEKIIRAEVEAEIMTEGQPQLLDVGSSYSEADEALALLKTRVAGQLGAGEGAQRKAQPRAVELEDEEEPAPVDDSLAELKAKLKAER